jgi:hypothetical protein
MDVLSRELGRQKIDKEIRVLKTRRNALAPISRLPTEILTRIFTTIAYSCLDCFGYPTLSWICSVTAVCGHWRAIALECPSLWCFISFNQPIWAEEMLRRSKMAPLTIKVDDSIEVDDRHFTPKMLDSVRLALQHISRIRDLHIVTSRIDMSNLFDHHAPLLQSLHIHLNYSSFFGYSFAPPQIPIVGGGYHLRRLELINCDISWESPLLCDLVHLKLHDIFFRNPPTITQLLDALDKMPLLETLDLDGYLPIVSDEDNFDTKRVVHLSHLTILRLSSDVIECVYLLNHISYPASTSLGLDCMVDVINDELPALCGAISSVWNGRDGSGFLRCLCIGSWSDSTRLHGWTAIGEKNEIQPCEPAQLNVNIRWHMEEEIMVDICNALTLTNLRMLDVYVLIPVPESTWLSAFGNLTSLRTVHVSGPAMIGLVSALSTGLRENPSEEHPSSDDTGEVFLPNLHDLGLKAKFGYDTTIFNNMELFEDLRDCLMNRYHWNAEVRKLHLECTREYYDQVELLREIVVDVDWVELDVLYDMYD